MNAAMDPVADPELPAADFNARTGRLLRREALRRAAVAGHHQHASRTSGMEAASVDGASLRREMDAQHVKGSGCLSVGLERLLQRSNGPQRKPAGRAGGYRVQHERTSCWMPSNKRRVSAARCGRVAWCTTAIAACKADSSGRRNTTILEAFAMTPRRRRWIELYVPY